MADRPALLMVQAAIASPDEAWPVIHEQIFEALHSMKPDHVRTTLRTPQETVAIERLASHYLVRVQVDSLRDVQKNWTHHWLDHLFEVVTKYRIGCDWFPSTGRRPNRDNWWLEDCVGLIIVRSDHNPTDFASTVQRALELGLPVVRIDPESHKMMRLKQPMKETDE